MFGKDTFPVEARQSSGIIDHDGTKWSEQCKKAARNPGTLFFGRRNIAIVPAAARWDGSGTTVKQKS
jgi:hypothetical protein